MGLFDNIKRKRELSKLEKLILSGGAHYEDLPYDLKNDIDYLIRIVDSDKRLYEKVPMDLLIKIIMLKPEIGANIDYSYLITIVSYIKTKSDIKFDYGKLFSHVPFEISIKFLGLIPKEEIKNVYSLEQQISIIDNELNTTKSPINDSLMYFNTEAIYEIVRRRKEAYDKYQIERPGRDFHHKLNKLNISCLPIDIQLEVVKIDPYFINSMSHDGLMTYVNNNPLLLDMVCDDRKREVRVSMFETFNSIDNFWNIMNKSKYEVTDEDRKNLTIPNAKKYILGHRYYETEKITDYFRGDALVELAKFSPSAVNQNRSGNNYRKPKYLANLYRDYISKHMDSYRAKPLLDYFDTSGDEFDFFRRIDYRFNDPSYEFCLRYDFIPMVVLNDSILKKCDPNLILEFIKNPSNRDLMLEIVSQAFGEEARKILEERKEITYEQIPSFDIFDKSIFENFGVGVIQNALSYDNEDGYILGELARNPVKMNRFKIFSEILKDHFSDSAIDFHKKLIMFFDLDDILLDKIDLNILSEEDKNNLRLLVTDRYHGSDIKYQFTATSIQELHEYENRRNKMYDEAIEKSDNSVVIKNAIFGRFFGLDYYERNNLYVPSTSDFSQLRIRYSLDTFLTNVKTKEYTDLTSEEMDMLEIANIISHITDSNILKDLYESLSKRDDVLSPNDFKTIREKVSNTYSRALIDSLTTIDDMTKMVDDNRPGISHEQLDDIDIFRLSGAPFRMYIHTTGLNNSGIRLGDWMSLEDGISTISGCLIEPFLLESCANEESISYGFTNIEPSAISGMGHTDIFASHLKRRLETSFEYGRVDFEYPDELVRKTRAQIDGTDSSIQKDPSHSYNEVTLYRREHDPSKIEEGTFGGKRIPDYIVCYGERSLGNARKQAKYFATYNGGKPLPIAVIDVNKYRNGYAEFPDYLRRSNEQYEERDQSELVSSVKEVGGMTR